ncbi:replication endonuclease [Natranaeroarchaeum aerophilus]|uniref:Replication endonuclease n=1 Tax=Natranaeroarchaeum aerophilus TaxID=2917711 RepID=A0AAE3K3I3_9EURY|nr:replication endonuclease [Natranaeroarchaeum aerophilus]
MDYLSDRGLTAYGQTSDSDELTDRNRDRVRLLKFLAQHPEGYLLTSMTHLVLKGNRANTHTEPEFLSPSAEQRYDAAMNRIYDESGWTALDGSDDDYQFTLRFFEELAQDHDLVRLEDSNAGRVAHPTLELLDLISEGITETDTESNELVYDREYCQNLLKSTTSGLKQLSDSQKELFANSLRRYIQRTNDYRLVFDVHFSGRRTGQDKRRMTKRFNTRFTSEGRVNKAFARLQSSLEWGYEHGDNGVFCTLTTDPKQHDSLWSAIQDINENFHRLTQFLKSDPSTVKDTRREGVPSWSSALDSSNFHFGQEGAVSGRPRQRLEYVKVLEFTSAGYPHLHVLFFNVPTRDTDGMPWLIDKNELSEYWDRYGQGKIVDLYPLTYRDDLDELPDAQFNSDEGFVSWYRYGDHEHSEEWIEDKARWHKKDGLINMDGSDEVAYQKTAGSYIGKYISETYAALLDSTDSLENGDHELDDDGKAAFWKLAMYWCTQRRFWSISKTIEEDIALDDQQSDEVRRAVHEATKSSVLYHADLAHESHACYPEIDIDSNRAQSTLHDLIRGTLVDVEFLGTYAYWDMPAPNNTVNIQVLEELAHDDCSSISYRSTGDRPPPVEAVW